MQDLQRALGFVNSAVDGSFGPDVEHAICEFQLHHEIPVTGEADEATNALLFSDVETLMQFREDE